MVSFFLSRFRCASIVAASIAWLAFLPLGATAADPFREQILPFVKTYCLECHSAKSAEAELNLERYESAETATADFRQWENVIIFVQREEMPPKTAKQQPSAESRAEFLETLRAVFDREARRLAGDPGIVLPRRLSNAEYDHTIRDLTGVDIHPTRSFPVDPAGGEGFDNTGEALNMSASLFAKLYAAAQHVADHALLTTKGLMFAPYPVANFADRVKYCEQAILQFYEQHKVDYDFYLTTCWEYDHRGPARSAITIDEFARERQLSPKYLSSLYEMLRGDPKKDGFYARWLRERWSDLPGPTNNNSPAITAETRGSIRQLAKEIQVLSKVLCRKETEAIIANAGNGPVMHLEHRRQSAAERDVYEPRSSQPGRRLQVQFNNLDRQPTVAISLTVADFGPHTGAASPDGFVILKSLNFTTAKDDYKPNDEKRNIPLRKLLAETSLDQFDRLKFGIHPLGDPIEPDDCVITIPGSVEIEIPSKALGDVREVRFYVDAEIDRSHSKSGVAAVSLRGGKSLADLKAANSPLDPSNLLVSPEHDVARDMAESAAAFCRLFPNRFYFVDDTRGLSAGFHLIEGFFRDDQPLCKHVLSDDENRELNRLWTELDFITGITEKMLRGFVFFERSERNFLKHADFDPFKEDPKLVETETLDRFERVYLERSSVKAPIEELGSHPIHVFFEQIRNGLKLRRQQLHDAEPVYLRNIEDFARSAYRRPLSTRELADVRSFFHDVASHEEYGLEQAVRASLVRILVSPFFCCRIDPAPPGETVQPLTDLSLASRLSYFLWSSMPDAELLAIAEKGQLHDEEVLLAQTRRMLKDSRVSDFAREFFGQWLSYRDFVEQESVDRDVYREFDEPLKQAMFEEPTHLATYLIQQDKPVTELLDADMTFVNGRLARHYGVPFGGKGDDWVMADGLQSQGRRGILGMAVFLTKNSQPQRTSPVKRGFWLVHKVLGEHIPAPPADVVALPAKETDTNGKTIRELLALHVEAEKCARCHQRFDAVGLAMEGFDRIGRIRTKDLAGRAVDNVVRLADGTEARGVPDFARYLAKHRREDFVRTLCRKLLGYSLGRSLQLSDDVLLEEMRVALDKNGDRFVPLFETIIRSPQFRNQRCRDFALTRFRTQNQEVPR